MLFVAGMVFESVGDEQLRRFRADRVNRGKVLDTGLWRYTRHPNYFGEALLWWGFGLIGAATGGVPGLLGPAILTYLLIHVSGVALLESTLIEKAGYIQYVGRTPAFLPLPPQVRVQLMAKLRGLPEKATCAGAFQATPLTSRAPQRSFRRRRNAARFDTLRRGEYRERAAPPAMAPATASRPLLRLRRMRAGLPGHVASAAVTGVRRPERL